MKKYDLCGLGNALVDLLFECSEADFSSLGMQKGAMRLIDSGQQTELISQLGRAVTKASGGSVANSVALFAQLGGRASLLCSLADDSYGQFFREDLAEIGVDVFSNSVHSEDSTSGTSVVVVTPDAERSMSTCLAASGKLSSDHINKQVLSESKWLFIEGYLIANGESARDALVNAISHAKSNGVKVAITMSDAFVVNGFFDFIQSILPDCDLIFCNNVEAQALAEKFGQKDAGSYESYFDFLSGKCAGFVMTAGDKGAYIKFDGHQGHVAAFACDPVDLTGAGDAFAGGFLSGIANGMDPFDAAKRGCIYASKVIQQWGARLSSASIKG